jgi:hypothetical protein
MKRPSSLTVLFFFVLSMYAVPSTFAQTQTPLTNADIVNLTKQGLDPGLIVKEVQSSGTNFNTTPQSLIDLKNAGVDNSVIDAMLSAQAQKPTASVDAVRGATSGAVTVPMAASKPVCNANDGCLLKEGIEVPLKFASSISSKTANEGDPVEFVLDDDLKVGDSIVVSKGAHALATVTTAKKAGMMGRPGDLAVQIQYLVVGSNRVHIRGTKGREGDSKTGAAVALTVLFGPIGLIKHGKNVEIPAGSPFTAYVDQDIWLAPAQ